MPHLFPFDTHFLPRQLCDTYGCYLVALPLRPFMFQTYIHIIYTHCSITCSFSSACPWLFYTLFTLYLSKYVPTPYTRSRNGCTTPYLLVFYFDLYSISPLFLFRSYIVSIFFYKDVFPFIHFLLALTTEFQSMCPPDYPMFLRIQRGKIESFSWFFLATMPTDSD